MVLNIILGILFGIFTLGICVFIHELGHFLLAKWNKVRVYTFSIGFLCPKWKWWRKLFHYHRNGTDYQIGIIPLGGYVQMKGENGNPSQDKDSFFNKSRWQRALILVAGVTFNFIFGWMLIFASYQFGYNIEEDKHDFKIQSTPIFLPRVNDDSVVVSIKGTNKITKGLYDIQKISLYWIGTGKVPLKELSGPVGIIYFLGKAFVFYLHQRANSKNELILKIEDKKPEPSLPKTTPIDKNGEPLKDLRDKVPDSKTEFYNPSVTFASIKPKTVITDEGEIAEVAQEKKLVTSPHFLLFCIGAFFILIGMFNILPIPPLDGGLLFILGIESVIRRDIPTKFKMLLYSGFTILLICFMVFVTYYDFGRIGGVYGKILFCILMLIPGYYIFKHLKKFWKEWRNKNGETKA